MTNNKSELKKNYFTTYALPILAGAAVIAGITYTALTQNPDNQINSIGGTSFAIGENSTVVNFGIINGVADYDSASIVSMVANSKSILDNNRDVLESIVKKKD